MSESPPADGASPSRIIHIPRRFTEKEWGGTETVIYEICREQVNAGLQPEIATSKALDNDAFTDMNQVPIHRFNYVYPFFGLSAQDRQLMDKKGGNLFSYSLLRYLMKAKGTRVFHAHALKRVGGIVRTAARWRKRPYVVSLHGGVFDVPQAELAGMMEPIKNKTEWGRALGAILGSRRVLDDADHVICVGKSEAEKASQSLPHDRVSYLPNGVDTEKFKGGNGSAFRQKYGIHESAHLTLCLSRIDPQKNQLCLVEAFAKENANSPESHLVLVGPFTHPGYAEKIKEAIGRANLADRIHLIPGLANTDPDLVNGFHAADLFVLPSLHEPFGIVVLEAWSCRKPVIASQVGGLQTVVTDGKTGLFFRPDAEDAATALARQIRTLREAPAQADALAQAGYDEAHQTYGWREIARKLDAIYQQAEDHSQARRSAS